MGLTVKNQINTKKFFSLSTIDEKSMREAGVLLTVQELKERARSYPPWTTIMTGNPNDTNRQRETKIYRYEDFADIKSSENLEKN